MATSAISRSRPWPTARSRCCRRGREHLEACSECAERLGDAVALAVLSAEVLELEVERVTALDALGERAAAHTGSGRSGGRHRACGCRSSARARQPPPPGPVSSGRGRRPLPRAPLGWPLVWRRSAPRRAHSVRAAGCQGRCHVVNGAPIVARAGWVLLRGLASSTQPGADGDVVGGGPGARPTRSVGHAQSSAIDGRSGMKTSSRLEGRLLRSMVAAVGLCAIVTSAGVAAAEVRREGTWPASDKHVSLSLEGQSRSEALKQLAEKAAGAWWWSCRPVRRGSARARPRCRQGARFAAQRRQLRGAP